MACQSPTVGGVLSFFAAQAFRLKHAAIERRMGDGGNEGGGSPQSHRERIPGMLGELFDPQAELFVREHFARTGVEPACVAFITFRTHDSIPARGVAAMGTRKTRLAKAPWMRHDAALVRRRADAR